KLLLDELQVVAGVAIVGVELQGSLELLSGLLPSSHLLLGIRLLLAGSIERIAEIVVGVLLEGQFRRRRRGRKVLRCFLELFGLVSGRAGIVLQAKIVGPSFQQVRVLLVSIFVLA